MTQPNSFASVMHLDRQVHPSPPIIPTSYAVVIPEGTVVGNVIPSLGGPGIYPDVPGLPSMGIAIRFLVDPLLDADLGGGPLFCIVDNFYAAPIYTSLDAWYATDGAGNVEVMTMYTFGSSGLRSVPITFPQSELPAAGNFVTLWMTCDQLGYLGQLSILTDDTSPEYTLEFDGENNRAIVTNAAYGWAYGSGAIGPNTNGLCTVLLLGASFNLFHSGDSDVDSLFGGITVDGIWGISGSLVSGQTLTPDPNSAPVLYTSLTTTTPVTNPAPLFIYTFDTQTLAEFDGGPTLFAIDGEDYVTDRTISQTGVTYVQEGSWGTAATVVAPGSSAVFTIPYNVALDQITDGHLTICRLDTNVWLEDPRQAVNNGVTISRPALNQIAVNGLGNMAGVPVLIGILYNSQFEWSTIYYRNQKGGAEQRGRLRLGYLDMAYAPSTDFTFIVTPQGRNPYRYTFYDPTAQQYQGPGNAEFKPFHVPLQCRNEDSTITVTDTTPGSFRFVSYAWEGTLSQRSRTQ